jgi:ANTAR domain
LSTQGRVHEALLELAGKLDERLDMATTLEALTRCAIKSVPGFDAASVSVREGHQPIRTLAPTNDLANQLDQVQYDLSEGPCYDVISGDRSTVVTFMADDSRWPHFAPRAAELGVGSMMSFELADKPGWRAALNLYSGQGGWPEGHAVDMAQLYAAHAAVTLGLVERIEQLESGLRTRTVIGEAVGIMMQRYALTHDRAFRFLVRLSNETNVKLRDIAADVVHEQETGGGAPPPRQGRQAPKGYRLP